MPTLPSLTNLAPALQKFFTETADTVAHATGFVRRTSKLSGALFLQVLALGFAHQPKATLTDLVETAAAVDVTLSKQGLHERVQQSEAFLQAMFAKSLELLSHGQQVHRLLLQQFSAVYITDSTTLALPATLQAVFPGCGGDGPAAALKIQLTLEVLRGFFARVTLQSGRTPDQAYRDDLNAIHAGALYLMDLGYFTLARFRALADGQAYFLSRCAHTTTRLEATPVETFDLLLWLQTCPEPQFERAIQLGAQAKLPWRWVGVRVPQEVADQRRRRAQDTARRKGRTPSERYLALLAWSLFMTNAPATRLTTAQVLALYPLRWQIELMFKLWKSDGGLAHVAGRLRARVLGELYAKLIGLVIMLFLSAPFRGQPERELSPVKAIHIIRHQLTRLWIHLFEVDLLTLALLLLEARLQKNAWKDARQKRLTTYQQLRVLETDLA